MENTTIVLIVMLGVSVFSTLICILKKPQKTVCPIDPIHKMRYLNPIYIQIKTFIDGIKKIDNGISTSHTLNAFYECLYKIDLFDMEEKMADYAKMIADVSSSQNANFNEKIYKKIIEIIKSKETDIKAIEELEENLEQYYPQWKAMVYAPKTIRTPDRLWFIDYLKGEKTNAISQTSGTFEDYLTEEDFINLYNETILKFIELSFNLVQTLDREICHAIPPKPPKMLKTLLSHLLSLLKPPPKP